MAAGSRKSHCSRERIRGIDYNIRCWGRENASPVIFLHGTQDSSITFQFLVDALEEDWFVVAPDWRGHGHSAWVDHGYWFHDLLGDLDAIVDLVSPQAAVPIVGHSLGGNVGGVYAGLRPDRVSRFISLDAFGPLTRLLPVDIADTLRRMMALRTSDRQHRVYASLEDVAGRLGRKNARLNGAQALFLAENLTRELAKGGRVWLFDPRHQMALPTMRTLDEWQHVWSGTRCPVLWLSSDDKRPGAPTGVEGEMERRIACMPHVTHMRIAGTTHNLHHDEPAAVAELVERFIVDPLAPRFPPQIRNVVGPRTESAFAPVDNANETSA